MRTSTLTKLLTSAVVLTGLAAVSPEAHAQAYPYCVLGTEANLFSAPGGPWIGTAPYGSAIQVSQTAPGRWLYINFPGGSGWVSGRFVDPGCVPVGCYGNGCSAPAPCYNGGCTPPVPTRGREKHVWDEHHEVEAERGWPQVGVPYSGPYYNGNGSNGNGNGGKGQYQETPQQ